MKNLRISLPTLGLLAFIPAASAFAGMPPLDWTIPTAAGVYWYTGTSDAWGNAIAAGWIDVAAQNDWLVRKYDTNGNPLWEDVYAGAANGDDSVLFVTTDAAGNIVAGGRTTVSGQNWNWMIRKYAPDGTILWTQTYNAPANGADMAWGVTVDSNGDVIAGGQDYRTEPGQSENWRVAKYRGSDGALLWSRSHNGPMGTGNNDGCYNVATDAARNVYAVGHEGANTNLATFWRMIKYDANGNLVWTLTNPGRPGNTDSRAQRVIVDAAGNAYVIGTEVPNGWPDYDWLFCKYDPSGNLLWQKIYDGPSSTTDGCRTLVQLSDGTLVAGGFQTSPSTSRDWLLRAYDPAGTFLWSFTLSGVSSDELNGLGSDACDGLYLMGRYGTGSRLDRYTFVPDCSGPTAVTVRKTVTPANPGAGQPVTYTILVTNSGSATLTALTVTDTVPSGVTMSSQTSIPALAWNSSTTLPAWTGALSLEPGQTATITIGATVVPCSSGTVSNTAWVRADSWASAVQAASATAFTVAAAPALAASAALTQTGGGMIGAPVTYTIAVTNTGGATIDSLTIVDTVMPQVVDPVAGTPPGWSSPAVTSVAGSGTRFVWTGTGLALAPGATTTFTISGACGLVCAAVQVSNTAYVRAATACGETQAFSNAVGSRIAPAVTGLTITKTQTPAAPATGNAVRYEIVVTNTGAATVTNIVVVDTVSALFTGGTQSVVAGFTALPVAQGPSGTVFSWINSAPFLPGTSATFQLDGTAGAVCLGTAASNTAYLAASTACTTTRMASNPAGFVMGAPAMSIGVVKTQTGGNGIGAPVTYSLAITNTGGATIDSLTVVDTVSPLLRNVVTTEPGFGAPSVASVAGTGTRYVWTGTGLALAPAGTITITVDGQMGAVCAPTAVSNTAYVTARDVAYCAEVRGFSNGVGSVIVPPVTNIAIARTRTPASPATGAAVQYEIVVTNTGAATIDALEVVDTVSPVVTGTTASQPGSFGAPAVDSVTGGTRYVWSAAAPGLLPPGGSLTFRVDGTAGFACAAITAANEACAAAGNGCGTVRIAAAPDSFVLAGNTSVLTAVVRTTPSAPANGAAVRYTIIVTNAGPATAADITIVDTLPAGVEFTAQSASAGLAWNNSGTRPAWTGTVNLAPGSSVTVTVDAIASSTFAGVVTNTAWAITPGACGPAQVSASAAFTLQPPDDMGGARVKIVGGIRGYIQPKRGEQATILVKPTDAGRITVRIYNLRGDLVRELVADGSGGKTEVLHWNATDSSGADVPPGAYPVLIEAPGIRYRDTLAVIR